MIQRNHIAPGAERAKSLRTHVPDGPVDLTPGRLQARLRECTRTQSDQYGRLELALLIERQQGGEQGPRPLRPDLKIIGQGTGPIPDGAGMLSRTAS